MVVAWSGVTDWRLSTHQSPEKLALYRQVLHRAWADRSNGWSVLLTLRVLQPCEYELKLLTWFNDRPARECYYSLHNLARTGTFLDKKIGEWFGPSTAAYVLRYVRTAAFTV